MSALTRCALSFTSGSARRCCRSSTKRSCARLAAALPRPVGSTRTASRLPLPMCSALSRWRGRSRSTTSRSLQPPRCAKPRTAPRSPPRSKRFAGSRWGSSMAAKREGCRGRAIARLHIEQTRYPLHIIHQYKIARRPAEAFLELVAAQSRRSLERVTGMSRRRLEVVPLAATILRRLIAAGRPDRLVFSAFGLREGYAYGVLPGGERADPLIAGAMTMARRQSRPGNDGDRLLRWISPVFPRLNEARRRLYRAACWLSDTAWTEHPDYRAELAFLRSLRMPVGAIEHSERAFIALAMHARYGGPADDPVKTAALPLLDDDAAAEARSLGLALRLAYTLCGGALDLLDQVLLDAKSNTLVLELPASGGLFVGEAVQRRLDALGRAMGLATRPERRLNPTPVLA